MSEDIDNFEIIAPERLGYATWSFGIITGIFCWLAQYVGLLEYHTSSDEIYLWWPQGTYTLFMWVGIAWAISLTAYYRKLSEIHDRIINFMALLTSSLTLIFLFSSYMFRLHDYFYHTSLLAAETYLGLGGITLGLTLVLAGLGYMRRKWGSRALSVLTGLIFLITGCYGVYVGVGSGLSAIPMVTIYDMPSIPVVAMISSIMGVIINANSPSQKA